MLSLLDLHQNSIVHRLFMMDGSIPPNCVSAKHLGLNRDRRPSAARISQSAQSRKAPRSGTLRHLSLPALAVLSSHLSFPRDVVLSFDVCTRLLEYAKVVVPVALKRAPRHCEVVDDAAKDIYIANGTSVLARGGSPCEGHPSALEPHRPARRSGDTPIGRARACCAS